MDKAKLIQTLNDIPEEFFKTAYVINADNYKNIYIQMKYNTKLVIQLMNANRWKHRITGSGFTEFKRDDGLEVVMT